MNQWNQKHQFGQIRNTFQEKLKEDIKLIKESRKTKTSADKTSNSNIKKQINLAEENLVRDKEVIKQKETNHEGYSFMTIKDHKPANNELERISKLILD